VSLVNFWRKKSRVALCVSASRLLPWNQTLSGLTPIRVGPEYQKYISRGASHQRLLLHWWEEAMHTTKPRRVNRKVYLICTGCPRPAIRATACLLVHAHCASQPTKLSKLSLNMPRFHVVPTTATLDLLAAAPDWSYSYATARPNISLRAGLLAFQHTHYAEWRRAVVYALSRHPQCSNSSSGAAACIIASPHKFILARNDVRSFPYNIPLPDSDLQHHPM
jgi:hypothetical protein